METFKIDAAFNKDSFIHGHLIKWEIVWRKNRKHLIGYSLTSIIILSLGALVRIFEEKSMNPYLFLGILLSVFTLFLLYIRIVSKQQYSRKIKATAEKFDAIKMDCSYEFSDESVKYWDKEKNVEFKWSLFSNYSIYKNFLILFSDNSPLELFIFKKEESDIELYHKLLDMVKSKLQYKEIK